MSRTFKDKPYKLQHPRWDADWVWTENYGHRWTKTTKTKKRKELDTEDHWMTTPMWWIRLVMSKPERRAAKTATHKALLVEDLEEVDIPDLGRKPHIYFW